MQSQDHVIDQIKNLIEELSVKRYPNPIRLQDIEGFDAVYYKKIPYNVRSEAVHDKEGFDIFTPDSMWGGRDQHYYFRFTFKVPDVFDGRRLLMFVSTGADDIWNTDNPQMMIYVNRKLTCAMDMNHDHILISERAQKGDEYEIGIYAYSNTMGPTNSLGIKLTSEDEDIIKVYYDMVTPFEAAMSLPDGDKAKDRIIDTLYKASSLDICNISKYLCDNLYGKDIPNATVSCIGHTHIDVAWKWPLRQTREKVIRSWTNVLKLMERYPEYHFMASTPQLYEFVSEDEPELFNRIKDKVKEGRFEPEGCMWLEPDCNLPSGESLIRQIIYGQRYFKENFGHETQVLWIPDAFGYSASLPQILVKSGIRYFMTTKLSWNDTNRLPDDLMYFKGIDGSKVLLYIITTCDNKNALQSGYDKLLNYTYNGLLNPSQVMGTWNAFRGKDITDNVLTCYGYGDGGGGPTEDMLEKYRRMNLGIPGCPRTIQTSLTDFFHKLEDDFLKAKDKPEWSDELYLEYHRGTYTSMGAGKRYNRLSEYMIQDAEFLCCMNMLISKNAYPSKELDDIWKIILLNQFHDILPGSSIEDVYIDSANQYEKILMDGHKIIDNSAKELIQKLSLEDKSSSEEFLSVEAKLSTEEYLSSNGNPSSEDFICINTAGHDRGGYVNLPDGTTAYITKKISAKGLRLISGSDLKINENYDLDKKAMSAKKRDDGSIVVSTLFYEAVFDARGELSGLFDKTYGRMVQDGSDIPLGRIIAFEDKPKEYDCWNIDRNYEDIQEPVTDLQKMDIVQDDPYTLIIHIERRFRQSTISQNVIFYKDIKRIDFETDIDWNEHQVLLKAAFPLNISADKVNAQIQFGNIERTLKPKTSWEEAKFETYAHTWVDMSEDKYESVPPSHPNWRSERHQYQTISHSQHEVKYGVAILNDCKYGYDARDNTIRLTLLKSGIDPNPNADIGHHHFTYSIYPHKGDYREGRVCQQAEDLNRPLMIMPIEAKAAALWSIEDGLSIIDTATEDGIFLDTVKKAEESDDIIVRMYEGYGIEHSFKVSVPKQLIKAAGYEKASITICDLREKELDGPSLGEYTINIKPFEIVTLKLHFE